ncbi:MAG: carbohydrate-binding protein [Bacteroidales bacterium]|nr:carbohydrate-binding protein [Bacteroidales bacterium]
MFRKIFIAISVYAFFMFFSGSAHATDTLPKFKVLAFFNANWDAAHISFAHECNRMFPLLAEQYGFQYDSTKDWGMLNESTLEQYQVVLFLDGYCPPAQRAEFEKYMRNGGSWLGFHVCAFNQDPSAWDWYFNQFLGMGSYKSNTWEPTTAVLQVENTSHPATLNLPATFVASPNEWYAWMVDLREKDNIDILCSVHPSSFPLGTGTGAGGASEIWHEGYYPVVWTNTDYNMLYINMGHNKVNYSNNTDLSLTFDNETQNQLIIDALFWLAELNAPDPMATKLSISKPLNYQVHIAPADIEIEVSAKDSNGIKRVDFFIGNTLLGSDTAEPYCMVAENTGIGLYNIRVVAVDSLDNTATISVSIDVQGTGAYLGVKAAIPGKIEAENYDYGGQNTGYFDTDAANRGGQCRQGDGVDIETCTDAGGGFNVGYIAEGEWLKYTVDIAEVGYYTMQARVASENAGKYFHVEAEGENISGKITVPNTGGWQNWHTINIPVNNLPAGEKTLKLVFDTDGFNLNYLNFSRDTLSSIAANTNKIFSVFPNPSTGIVQLLFNETPQANHTLNIFDISGRLVKSFDLTNDVGTTEIQLDLSDLANGQYYIEACDTGLPVSVILF